MFIQYILVSNNIILYSKFYYMQEYSNEQIETLGLQIGCVVRLERLKKKISQEKLGLLIGSNNTQIGRIERYETATSWKYLFKICQYLEIDFQTLFILKSTTSIFDIIKECRSLEEKLTKEKEQYYINLEAKIKKLKS